MSKIDLLKIARLAATASAQAKYDHPDRVMLPHRILQELGFPNCLDDAEAIHDSDCAVHAAPAFPAGKCDCTLLVEKMEVEECERELRQSQSPQDEDSGEGERLEQILRAQAERDVLRPADCQGDWPKFAGTEEIDWGKPNGSPEQPE